ncbi:MAG: BrnA antitoxin family protein [Acetobacteraceae bacterium]|nr:BrnA antitoxin family protein [Acetobacteraceae bacterium]
MKGLTDWDRLAKMTDEEIEKAAAEDPDCPLLTDEQLAQMTVFVPPGPRRMVTMRIDEDVINWFSQFGRGYQTRINEVLKAYVAAQSKQGR